MEMVVKELAICGWYSAARGARLSYVSDGNFKDLDTEKNQNGLGSKDLKLLSKLVKRGTEHSKYVRFIKVYAEVTASLKFWTQFDTYNFIDKASTSQMHTLFKVPLTQQSFKHLIHKDTLHYLQQLQSEKNFKTLIYEMPQSYLYTKIICVNYQSLRAIYFQRRTHRLGEWKEFLAFIEQLPHAKELITVEE